MLVPGGAHFGGEGSEGGVILTRFTEEAGETRGAHTVVGKATAPILALGVVLTCIFDHLTELTCKDGEVNQGKQCALGISYFYANFSLTTGRKG